MQATNFIQKGRVLSLVAPYTRTAGQAAMIGSLLGVAHNDVTNGAVGVFDFEGTWLLEKTSAQAWALGAKIYWNAGTKKCSNVASDGPLVGIAMATAANPSSTGLVRLNGVPSETNAPDAVSGGLTAVVKFTDNSGGAAADNTIAAITAPAAIVDNSGGTAPVDHTMVVITQPNLASWDGATVFPSSNQGGAIANAILLLTNDVALLAGKQNTNRTAIVALTDAVTELATKVNVLIDRLRSAGVIVT